MSRKTAARTLGVFAIALSALVAVWKELPGSGTSNVEEPETSKADEGPACEALLRSRSVAQVVRSRPAINRLVVDEHAWFALPENSRRLLVSTARCAALQEDIDYAVVYGAKTQQRLALASAQVVILD